MMKKLSNLISIIKKNKKMCDERLKTMPTNMVEFEKRHQEQLKVEVKKPTRIKIDDYQKIKDWADAQYFKEYDPEWINSYISCSGMQYKKNEWDKIKHENYKVIEDKYRK